MELSRITVDPEVGWGTPYIRDTDISVGRVIQLSDAGFGEDEILEQLPGLTLDDIDAALEWYVEYGTSGLAANPPEPNDPRISVDPAVQGGQPTITGTRIPVDVIAAMWERGFNVGEIIADYPSLGPEDVDAAVAYMEYVAGIPEEPY